MRLSLSRKGLLLSVEKLVLVITKRVGSGSGFPCLHPATVNLLSFFLYLRAACGLGLERIKPVELPTLKVPPLPWWSALIA